MTETQAATRNGLARLDELAAEREIELRRDAPIAPLTTLRVGGPADRLVEARDGEQLLAALRLARDAGVPWFVLGNGSDLVVADAGLRGLVIRNRAKAIAVDGSRLTADAGTPMAMLVKRCTADGLAGPEFGISIPGTLGGAVWANAGAHGGEMRDVVAWVDAWDPATDDTRRLAAGDCAFAYRESRFKHADEVVLAAALDLEPGELERIAATVAEHQAQRVATQPLADQNAGSVFRNPPGDHAGRLIDAAGLKGFRIGSAQVSELHANFIVTDRGGSAADVRALGDAVRATVEERFDVRLAYEIEFVGDWPADDAAGGGRAMSKRLRIGIVAGGRSAEHEVSVASAEAVLAAIDRERYEPYLVYIDRQGHWHLPAGPAPELAGGLAGRLGIDTPADHTAHLAEDASALPATVGEDALAPRSALRSLAEVIDVAFLVLHGPYGEDGTLQGFLELAGIPYTGAGVLASALAMDKIVFKDLMRGHDLPVVDYTWFRRSDWTDAPDAVLASAAAHIGPRSVVKPARLGSSLGMTVVHEPDELPGAIAEALRYDSKVIVEAYVANARELECGVIGNDQPQVFEPGEVRSHGEWYDYAAKYTEGLADVLPRADVSPAIAARVQELALAAYRAVDCAGFARVDFLVPDDAIYISEMNTIPGFTATSMFPKQAELAGIGFGQLVDRLVRLGLEREGPLDADAELLPGHEGERS